jgi:hypothetical protein
VQLRRDVTRRNLRSSQESAVNRHPGNDKGRPEGRPLRVIVRTLSGWV